MTEWWGKEITGIDETAPLAGHRVANYETDLLKVGFVFLERVMLIEVKVVR